MVVAVLGASGMLGSMVLDVLKRDPGLALRASVRSRELLAKLSEHSPNVAFTVLDAESADITKIKEAIGPARWVVNAVGVIKPYIHDDNPVEVERATRVNALFPHVLARAAAETGARILQIATDCVYSGATGRYDEASAHDPLDVYGKSKSLGEARGEGVHHLRCSIIGPEIKSHVSLLHWFLRQPAGASLKGFVNHRWNGVTTYHFARLCQGAIREDLALPHVQHVIPTADVSKHELLGLFARTYGREDITISPVEAPTVLDRTLSTVGQDRNFALWGAAGYDKPPTVAAMVSELASFVRETPAVRAHYATA
jgi:dTDP-4-dehydrorhamnose reductase